MIKPLLQAAINALVTHKHPGHMLVGDEATAWLAGAGLGYRKVATATGDLTGFGPEGMTAIASLSKAICDRSATFRRGVSFTTFAAAVADQVSAAWIAVVDVDGCQPDRSTEIADLAVDVAIAAVQLIVPVSFSRLMARITARTAPPWRGNLTIT